MLARFLKSLAGQVLDGRPSAVAPDVSQANDLAVDAQIARARALTEQSRFGEAYQALRAVDDPAAHPNVQFNIALVLLGWGRTIEAGRILRSLPDVETFDPRSCLRLGLAYQEIGEVERAVATLRRANVEVQPGSGVALARALFTQRKIDECADLCARLLTTLPVDPAVLVLLSYCRQRNGQWDAAERLLREASAPPLSSCQALLSLGGMLRIQGRWEDAIRILLEARELGPRDGPFPGATHLALAYDAVGERPAALGVLERELASHPSVDVHRSYAQMLLKQGRMVEAWPHYEFRWLAEPLVGNRMPLAVPEWQGQSLEGQRLLLRVEQGYGDAFQFLRYAQLLQSRGAFVKIARFCDLAPRFAGIDEVLDGPVDAGNIDYFANLLSLPKAFATDLDSIPANVPYVAPAEDKAALWRTRLDRWTAKPKIGLVWAGNPDHPGDRERSMSLTALGELLAIDELAWVSLQKGQREAEAKGIDPGVTWCDLGPELLDYGDTAAVIANLDLLICVDTSVAHLAGAIGRPVWVFLGTPSDWRWLDDREDTPWYPTMRLFRQSTPGQWSDVVHRAAAELRANGVGGVASGASGRAALQDATMSEPEIPGADVGGGEAIVHTRIGTVQYLTDGSVEGRSLQWYGEYLQEEVDVLRAIASSGSTGVMYGPGVGANAIWLSRHLGDDGLLVLVERRPATHRVLRQNLALHACANVTLLPHAPSSFNESVGSDPVGTIDNLQLDRLDFLMVGDHDNGLEVIGGASQSIWRGRPVLVLHLREEETWDPYVRKLDGFGYRAWTTDAPLFRTGNFNRRSNDIFSGRCVRTILAYPEEATPDRHPEGFSEFRASVTSVLT